MTRGIARGARETAGENTRKQIRLHRMRVVRPVASGLNLGPARQIGTRAPTAGTPADFQPAPHTTFSAQFLPALQVWKQQTPDVGRPQQGKRALE